MDTENTDTFKSSTYIITTDLRNVASEAIYKEQTWNDQLTTVHVLI